MIWRTLISFFSLILGLIYLGPVLVFSANRRDFSGLKTHQLLLEMLPHALCAAIVALAVTACIKIVPWRQAANRISLIFYFISVSLLVFMCYLPLSIGKLDGVDGIALSGVNLFLGLAAGGVALTLRKKATLVFAALLSGPLITASMALFDRSEGGGENFLPLSQHEKNVLVISFDNLQSKYVQQALTPHSKEFDGFRLYPEVTAVAPFSELSTLTTKMGALPNLPNNNNAATFFSKTFISSRLHNEGYAVETYGDFRNGELPTTSKLPYFSALQRGASYAYPVLLEAALLRVFPIPDVVQRGLGLVLFDDIGTSANLKTDKRSGLELKILQDKHELSHYKLDILQFDAFVNSLSAEDLGPTARFHHYLFTHEPIRFSETCEYGDSDRIRYVADLPPEAECAVDQMRLMIKKLKALKVFDNTLIIFASDHGPECPHNFTLEPGSYRVSQRWCLSRYQPFLLIKNFNDTKSLISNRDQVSLLDVAKTVCHANLPAKECKTYSGVNLFNKIDDITNKTRPILVSKTDEDERNYKDFRKVDIGRTQGIMGYFSLPRNEKSKTYTVESLGTVTGSLVDKRQVASEADPAGYVTFGPYAHLQAGRYLLSVTYTLEGDDEIGLSFWEVTTDHGDTKIFKTDFLDSDGEEKLASTELLLDSNVVNLELRTFYGGQGSLSIGPVKIERLD